MAGGVSVAAASASASACVRSRVLSVVGLEKPRQLFNATATLGGGGRTRTGMRATTQARVRLTATTKASDVHGKRVAWGYGAVDAIPASGTRAGRFSSRGGLSTAALRWRCSFFVDTWIGNAHTHSHPGFSRRRRAARASTLTRAIMDPAAYASFRGSLSYTDVFTTNIFAPE